MKHIKLFEEHNNGFTEFTLSDGDNEVMVDIYSDGTIMSIYTYKDCPMVGFDWESGDEYTMNKGWEQKNNALFVHCPKNQKRFFTTMKRLSMNGYVLSLDKDDESYNSDIEVFLKMLNKYDIKEENFI